MTTKTTKGISFPIKIGTSILLEEGHVLTEQTIKELHLGFEYERQKRYEMVEAERERICKDLDKMWSALYGAYLNNQDLRDLIKNVVTQPNNK